MIATGYHSLDVYRSIIFQIVYIFSVLQKERIDFEELSLENNFFIKDLNIDLSLTGGQHLIYDFKARQEGEYTTGSFIGNTTGILQPSNPIKSSVEGDMASAISRIISSSATTNTAVVAAIEKSSITDVALAKEFGPRGITVNAVAPGFIETKMTESLPEDVKKEYMRQIPLKKFGTPEDIADACYFLSSSSAKYITGQVLSVNGGMI